MNTLAKAMRAFVQSGCDRTRMNVPHWSATYHCDLDSVRAEWEVAMTAYSRTPQNTYGEGK